MKRLTVCVDHLHVAVHEPERRGAVEDRGVPAEAVARPFVVGVEQRHVLAGDGGQTAIDGGDQATMGWRMTFTRSENESSTRGVSSVDPSSTTITSIEPPGGSCPSALSIAAAGTSPD